MSTEPDCYGRRQRLTPEAFEAWSNMKQSAINDGVTVFLISAFRDAQYQHDLIARKISEGRSLEQILRVNAAPGFSEHHTGRAVDLGTHDCEALEEEFEQTDAFVWLERNAKSFVPDRKFCVDNGSMIAVLGKLHLKHDDITDINMISI